MREILIQRHQTSASQVLSTSIQGVVNNGSMVVMDFQLPISILITITITITDRGTRILTTGIQIQTEAILRVDRGSRYRRGRQFRFLNTETKSVKYGRRTINQRIIQVP
jgi:hypothetical protein